jgi:hypothetical protein
MANCKWEGADLDAGRRRKRRMDDRGGRREELLTAKIAKEGRKEREGRMKRAGSEAKC